jgi:hypothetical protein
METDELTPEEDARIKAAYYAAARFVWAELAESGDEDALREWEAARADIWTGEDAEADTRSNLLIEALIEYAAFLTRQAYGSEQAARAAAWMQVWARMPSDEAAEKFIARTPTAASV